VFVLLPPKPPLPALNKLPNWFVVPPKAGLFCPKSPPLEEPPNAGVIVLVLVEPNPPNPLLDCACVPALKRPHVEGLVPNEVFAPKPADALLEPNPGHCISFDAASIGAVEPSNIVARS
jgi:hypothetical protein